jgi:hypothetical protein
MAQHGNINNNLKKRTSNNWFVRNLQQVNGDGNDFMKKIENGIISIDPARILRDLSKGNVNIQQNAQYLASPVLLNSIEKFAYENAMEYSQIYNSLNYTIVGMNYNNISTDGYVQILAQKYSCKSTAYNIVYAAIQNFRMTGDIGHILGMVSELYQKRLNQYI